MQQCASATCLPLPEQKIDRCTLRRRKWGLRDQHAELRRGGRDRPPERRRARRRPRRPRQRPEAPPRRDGMWQTCAMTLNCHVAWQQPGASVTADADAGCATFSRGNNVDFGLQQAGSPSCSNLQPRLCNDRGPAMHAAEPMLRVRVEVRVEVRVRERVGQPHSFSDVCRVRAGGPCGAAVRGHGAAVGGRAQLPGPAHRRRLARRQRCGGHRRAVFLAAGRQLAGEGPACNCFVCQLCIML